MADRNVRFIRVRGRIVPIRNGGEAKPNQGMRAAALGVNIASGVVSGLAVYGGVKRIAFGQGASFGLDAISTGLSVGAFARAPGSRRARARGLAKDLVVNNAVGWGVMGATILANPTTRRMGIEGVKKASKIAAQFLVGRKLGRAF